MENGEIRNLLQKYIAETITPEERQKFISFTTSPENESSFKDILQSLLENSTEENRGDDLADFDLIYCNILSEIKSDECTCTVDRVPFFRSRKGKMIMRSTGIAALLAVAFFLGSLIAPAARTIIPEMKPVPVFTEVRSPYGSTSEIMLPDGSQVMLNAGSSLKYRSDFSISNRDLKLAGEAYFKVAKNNSIPMNVSAGNINIKAVGTEFNIKAYDDEPVIETTLVEGKVEITRPGTENTKDEFIGLTPNQKAIFIKETSSFTLKEAKESDPTLTAPPETFIDQILISPKVDVTQVAAWTVGKLVIKGENLEDLCIKLQRKFDVTFVFGDEEIKQFRFTGILLDETFEQVLRAIKLTAPIEYTVSGRTVYLNADKKELDKFSKHLK